MTTAYIITIKNAATGTILDFCGLFLDVKEAEKHAAQILANPKLYAAIQAFELRNKQP